MILTPSVVAPVRPFQASPGWGWLPIFASIRVVSSRLESRFRVAQSRPVAVSDWVESGVVSPRSARCSRASPITGTRLRALNRVRAGGPFPVDVYRVEDAMAHIPDTLLGGG